MNVTFNEVTSHVLTGRFTHVALRLATCILKKTGQLTTAVFPADVKEKDLPTTPEQNPGIPSKVVFTKPAQPRLIPAEGKVNLFINLGGNARTINTAGYIVGLSTTHYQLLPYEDAASNFPEKSEWFPISWVAVTRWA
jgi:hypothetical protein